jgi:hypothetical protein
LRLGFGYLSGVTTLHSFETTCLVKSVCSGMPSLDGIPDGDVINMNSAGRFVKRQSNDSDVSKWIYWAETH